MKKKSKNVDREEAREFRYNKGLTIKELAFYYGKSERTIYRWLNYKNSEEEKGNTNRPRKHIRSKRYPEAIISRIIELKKEVPKRSAPTIQRLLKQEFTRKIPSLSTIYKYFHEHELIDESKIHRKGYVKFERSKPNDLWQIDIAGVRTVGHLGKLYLIAILDDFSRYIVGAEYFSDQKGIHIIKVLRDAVLAYGRPNEILSDNGTQFRNLIGELGTKYTRLLKIMDINPIFARPNRPQTKGKLERWFGTVKQMFLIEAHHKVEIDPKMSLAEFNRSFKEWIKWYNTEKSHRSLPHNSPPVERYLHAEERVFRPLQAKINWKRWLHERESRKVTKYNEIHYKTQKYHIPPGYSGCRVEVIEYEDKLEIYYRDHLVIIHPYKVPIEKTRKTRKITHSGVIMYKGKPYTIDYKLAGKTVEVQEINGGKNLLVYLNGVLLKTLDL